MSLFINYELSKETVIHEDYFDNHKEYLEFLNACKCLKCLKCTTVPSNEPIEKNMEVDPIEPTLKRVRFDENTKLCDTSEKERPKKRFRRIIRMKLCNKRCHRIKENNDYCKLCLFRV